MMAKNFEGPRRRAVGSILVALIMVLHWALFTLPTLGTVRAAPPFQQEGFNATKIQRATVSVSQIFQTPAGQFVVSCVGTGTLVTTDGLVLTNAHVALPGNNCRADRLVIGLTVRLGEAPVATYYAQVVASNIGWDLAVLQITSTLDGKPVNRATLTLPFVELGDSELMRLDDTINVVGYTFSEERASSVNEVVRGTISGFTAEALVGERAWIKTSAVIPGGMSGGGAYNTVGQLVGIPTIEPARSEGATVNCRRIQDSNSDGRVDDQDVCVPISGFINALRPVRLARGLVLAATLGLKPSLKPAVRPDTPSNDAPMFSRLLFATGINQAGMPTTVVDTMPAGTTRLYLFFDYANMIDGMIYELRTTVDGVPNATFSLAPATWSGGRRGLWYIGSTAQVWPNGNYEFSLLIEGVRVASKQIQIGTAVRKEPSFSDILFGVPDSNGVLINTGNLLPVGSTINAEFIFNNMDVQANIPWRQIWYYEGVKINESSGTWREGANGKSRVNATATGKPLSPGRYRLELYIGDRLTATSDLIMAGALTSLKAEVFKNLTFATELKETGPAGTVGTTFSNTIPGLYAAFEWREMGVGTPWTWRWSVDGTTLFEVTQPWVDEPDGAANWLRLQSGGKLPDGSYKAELVIAGVVQTSATAKVGIGVLPPTLFGVAQGVQVQGRITDRETGRGIAGAAFIVIKVDFDTRDFLWQMAQVYEISFSDSEGNFTLPRLLPRITDKAYSVIVLARGYLPLSTNGIRIDDKTGSPLVFNIAMNRD